MSSGSVTMACMNSEIWLRHAAPQVNSTVVCGTHQGQLWPNRYTVIAESGTNSQANAACTVLRKTCNDITDACRSSRSSLHGYVDLGPALRALCIKDAIAVDKVRAAISILQRCQLHIGSGPLLFGVIRQTLERCRNNLPTSQPQLSTAVPQLHC